jgi:hypothetical protein
MEGIPHLLQGGSLAAPQRSSAQPSREPIELMGSGKIVLGEAMRRCWPRSPAVTIERSARVTAASGNGRRLVARSARILSWRLI